MAKETKKYLSKAEILGAEDRQYEDVETPEWGGTTRIRSLTAKEIIRWQKETKGRQGADEEKALSLLAVRSVVDGEGTRLFDDDDAEAILAKNAAVLSRVAAAALKLNRIREQDVQELVGN